MSTNAETRKGDWIRTYTGKKFWVLDPRLDEIDILDIAHSHALDNRFGGHTRVPYSVAEHCVRVARELKRRGASARVQLKGLVHDAPEAYIRDQAKPIKELEFFKGYCEVEDDLHLVIDSKFDVAIGPEDARLVKEVDRILTRTEGRDLMRGWIHDGPDPLPEKIHPWDWAYAEREFLSTFEQITTLLKMQKLSAG